MKILQEIHRRSPTVLLVEQKASMSLTTARRGYNLENGRILLEGSSRTLLEDQKVKKAYLGLQPGSRA
jgi:branched-chain amino acid transport system ATP-binding protein